MALKKQHLTTYKKQLHTYAEDRRDVIKHAGDALHVSKRAIFAMHRGEMKEAKAKLAEAEKMFKVLIKKYKKNPKMMQEGSFRAGVEEYVEASLFYQFLTTGNIGPIKSLPVEMEVYLAGLCDVPGELYRRAIKAATEQDIEMVKQCALMGEEIIGSLIEFNLTKYLRNKFDQAKQAANKLEYVVYEVSLRQEK